MTNFIRRFAAKWLLWIFGADRESDPDWVPGEAFGDLPHVPEKAKRHAA